MPAITLSRTLGSLGTEIARSLADGLGYRMMWREVINEAACRACTPEVALAVIDDLGLLGLRPSNKAHRAYLHAVKEIIEQLDTEGNVVVVGRAGQMILRDHADVLHVRITAPFPLRVERVATRHGISASAAQARVATSDRTRGMYVRRNYHVDWDAAALYDLVINTAKFSIAAAKDVIMRAWAQTAQR